MVEGEVGAGELGRLGNLHGTLTLSHASLAARNGVL
jgi:hypothetical protein